MNINSFTTGFSLELKKFWGFDHVCKEKEFKYGFVSLKVHELGTEKDQFWVFLLLHLSLLSSIRPAYISLHPVLTTVSDYITAVLCCAAECFIPTAQSPKLSSDSTAVHSVELNHAQLRREPLPPSLCSAKPMLFLRSLSSIKSPTHFRPGPMRKPTSRSPFSSSTPKPRYLSPMAALGFFFLLFHLSGGLGIYDKLIT